MTTRDRLSKFPDENALASATRRAGLEKIGRDKNRRGMGFICRIALWNH